MANRSTPCDDEGVDSDSDSIAATPVIAQLLVRSMRSRQPAMRAISAR